MNYNIVFLDFDGVLNSTLYLKTTDASGARGVMGLDPVAIQRLNRLVDKTDARVVVSSTWRFGRTVQQLREILSAKGFTGTVIGKTPELSGKPRGQEIQAWLDAAPLFDVVVKSFIILDDDADMFHLSDRLVKTNFEWGLEAHHVDEAVQLLRSPASSLIAPSKQFVAQFTGEGKKR